MSVSPVPPVVEAPAPASSTPRDHASEHIAAEVTGGPAALLWLRDRLAGVPAAPGCTTTDVPTMLATPDGLPFLASVFGETVAPFFGKPIGMR
jgi:hypothetical protein